MDDQYEDEVEATNQFQYERVQQLRLHKMVHSILVEAKNSKPAIPASFTKRICQQNGLECNQEVFYNVMASIVDYSLNDILERAKDVKDRKDRNNLTASDIQKILATKNIHFSNPRMLFDLGLSNSTGRNTLPGMEEQQ